MRERAIKIPSKYALAKELWIILLLKALVILALWKFCFSHPPSEHIKSDAAVAAHIYGVPSAVIEKEDKRGTI